VARLRTPGDAAAMMWERAERRATQPVSASLGDPPEELSHRLHVEIALFYKRHVRGIGYHAHL
jgi:hypothetical protein